MVFITKKKIEKKKWYSRRLLLLIINQGKIKMKNFLPTKLAKKLSLTTSSTGEDIHRPMHHYILNARSVISTTLWHFIVT